MFITKGYIALCALEYSYMNAYGLALPDPAKVNTIRSESGVNTARAPLAYDILLRIEPLGASITHGVASSDGNGYRQKLLDLITASAGNPVDFVGSNPNGTMANNANSGWPGLIIDDVHTKSNGDTPAYKPNLVLVNAGTNDAIQNIDIANAGARMQSLLTDIYAQSPHATIILSGLVRNADSAVQDRAVQINSQYQTLAGSLNGAGKPIIWADMQGSDGPLDSDLAPDGTHPLDQGYQKMANIWYAAISQADNAGFLKTAENM